MLPSAVWEIQRARENCALAGEVNARLAMIADLRRGMKGRVRTIAPSRFRIGRTASTTARESGQPKREEQQSPKQPLGRYSDYAKASNGSDDRVAQ